jgi:cobalamin synthase
MAVWLLWGFRPARDSGLAHSFEGQVKLRHALIAAAIAIAGASYVGAALLWPAFACAVCSVLIGAWAQARLGGVNGDVCGAAIELSELAFFLVCRVLSP